MLVYSCSLQFSLGFICSGHSCSLSVAALLLSAMHSLCTRLGLQLIPGLFIGNVHLQVGIKHWTVWNDIWLLKGQTSALSLHYPWASEEEWCWCIWGLACWAWDCTVVLVNLSKASTRTPSLTACALPLGYFCAFTNTQWSSSSSSSHSLSPQQFFDYIHALNSLYVLTLDWHYTEKVKTQFIGRGKYDRTVPGLGTSRIT